MYYPNSWEKTESGFLAIQSVTKALNAGGLWLVGKEHAEQFNEGQSKRIFNYLFRRGCEDWPTERVRKESPGNDG